MDALRKTTDPKKAYSQRIILLRAVSHRISKTPSQELPYVVEEIVATLTGCLQSPTNGHDESKSVVESSEWQKLKTQITTLLTSKSKQSRFAAVILIKTAVEIGGYETFSTCSKWVMGMINVILRSEDISTSKKISIINLTRIFHLAGKYVDSKGSIVTQNLPNFISACLRNTSPGHEETLVQTIFESFTKLIIDYPTVFRQHIQRIKTIVTPLLAPTHSTSSAPQDQGGSRDTSSVIRAARGLYVSLHVCNPKVSEIRYDYLLIHTKIFREIYSTTDKLFQDTTEESQQVLSHQQDEVLAEADAQVGSIYGPLDLPSWSGVCEGVRRITGLVYLLRQFPQHKVAKGGIKWPRRQSFLTLLRLSERASAVHAEGKTSRLKAKFGTEDLEILLSETPKIQKAVLETLEIYNRRLPGLVRPVHHWVYRRTVDIFHEYSYDLNVRQACYKVLSCYLKTSGLGIEDIAARQVQTVVPKCCDDILPPEIEQQLWQPHETKPTSTNSNIATNDNTANRNKEVHWSTQDDKELICDAVEFLRIFLLNIRTTKVSKHIRSRADRTAVLTKNADLMVASVVNTPVPKGPGVMTSSIIDYLAAYYPHRIETNLILHPRAPLFPWFGPSAHYDDDSKGPPGDPLHQTDHLEESTGDRGFTNANSRMDEKIEGLEEIDAVDSEDDEGTIAEKIVQSVSERASESTSHGNQRELEDPEGSGQNEEPSTVVEDNNNTRSPLKRKPEEDEKDPLPSETKSKVQKMETSDPHDFQVEPMETDLSEAEPSAKHGQLQLNPLAEPQDTSKSLPRRGESEDSGDDDENFEVPELTLEPDTDEE